MNGDGYSRDGGRSGGGSRSYSSRDDHRDRSDRGDRADRGGDRDRNDRGADRRRRRSRSPRHSSRRDYDVDSYSSSRDYREREREDTYARRERRDDRGERGDRHERAGRDWGDSYSRRDRPRQDRDRDDDRGPRRDRGERDGGDRGGRGRRDGGFGGRGGDRRQQKSPSPVAKAREPTPDLTSFVSIQVRQRRMTQWDIKPAGYEAITAEQAKLSGMFPLPGAPRAAPMDPTRLAAFMNPTAGSATAAALQPLNAKQAKRLFIYKIPTDSTPEEFVEFFNLQLNGLNAVSGRDPCTSAQIAGQHEYALLEFKTPEDATVALAMDNIMMREGMEVGLNIRRPRDYITPATAKTAYSGTEVSATVKDTPYKLCITNVPPFIDEDQLRELFETMGALAAFILVKEPGTEGHRRIAFCEYADDAILDAVIEGLNGIPLGDGSLIVKRACVGLKQQGDLDGGVGAISTLAGTEATGVQDHGRVICLLNMVTSDELINDDEYEEIKEDIEEECSKYGPIIEIKIPRPAGMRTSAGVGKIYIKYTDTDAAQKAVKALAGRQFSRRTVIATQFSEESFDVGAW